MDYLVNRDEVIADFQRFKESFETKGDYNEGFVDGLDYCISFVSTLPSAVRNGEWVPLFGGIYTSGAYWFECSECKTIVAGGLQSRNLYCKGCGAKMRRYTK